MGNDDLGLPDADDWKRINVELTRKDPRLLRDKATFDFGTDEVKPATDLYEWGEWMENASRHIARDEVSGFIVSTVFLGIDHSFGHSEPLWFETMVFRADSSGEMKGREDYEQWRYSTIEEARFGHKAAVEAVQKGVIGE